MATLDLLEEKAKKCTECELHRTRTNLVFGCGNKKADLMFIGEAPGHHEDMQGFPFVGAAGKLLDELLATIGLKRSDVYIANVLKCRPPNNRDPSSGEIDACKGFLKEQIKLISPMVIITLGNFSTKLLLKTETGISKMHGRIFKKKSFSVFPIYHPAAGLYTSAIKKVLFDDFKTLGQVLKPPKQEKEEAEMNDAEGSVAEQISLW